MCFEKMPLISVTHSQWFTNGIICTLIVALVTSFTFLNYSSGCVVYHRISTLNNSGVSNSIKRNPFLLPNSSLLNSHRCGSHDPNIEEFKNFALSFYPITDKVTAHSYNIMYGVFLSSKRNQPIKLLEIGLGCDMHYGPGASVQVWKNYLHQESEIWMADVDSMCVEKYLTHEFMLGINTLVGDQRNPVILSQWIKETGGHFDVIIDDGGHRNSMIEHSFNALWPALKSGGLYFVEDMQVGRESWQDRTDEGHTMPDMMQMWVNSLLVGGLKPVDLQFIFCQSEACVLAKK